ncbi:MAG: type II secretion system protein [bacterium]
MNILMARIFWVFAIKSLKMKLAKQTNIFRKGFTLAEVLMSLGIVGVVAAIIMVTVVPKIQDAQFKAKFKTVYSDVAQVTSKIKTDNGNSLKGVFTNHNVMRDKFKQYLNTIKSCDAGQAFGNCWHNMDGSSKYLNGTPITTGWGALPTIILNNGVLLRFWLGNSNCTSTTYSGSIQVCGNIDIDVNGFKGPNVVGKDIFLIWIIENGIKPWGINGDTKNCVSSDVGMGCAAKVLKGEDY